MFFDDLTKYDYLAKYVQHLDSEREENALNVGWLDKKYPFKTGETSQAFKENLFRLCQDPVNQTRGFHHCHFCENPTFGLEITRNNIKVVLGSAEIRVKNDKGDDFAAPNLIYHYVTDHKYLPPEEFINSVLSMD